MNRAEIILKNGKEKSIKRLHPWIFSGAIQKSKGQLTEGEVVDIFANSGEFLARGHYQPGSIAVRILTFDKTELIDANFWLKKLERAYAYREALGLTNNKSTNVYRLIHGEGDGLPGLIVDIYNNTCVIQCHSVGMHRSLESITDGLRIIYGDKLTTIFNKSDSTLPFKAQVADKSSIIKGSGSGVIASENGLQFAVDFLTGQKTGFFIDQRDNRELVRSFSAGRNVLNMFCYTGGFSVYALAGGANLVHSVDSSEPVIEMTNKNVCLNLADTSKHQAFKTDAFAYLEQMDDLYDLIILDPPAFAKHQNALKNALQGYKRINAKAIKKIKSGGILFTFSCSQVVSREEFRKSVFAASAQAGRSVRILYQMTQPADHPISMYHPEGEYLKGLVLYVE